MEFVVRVTRTRVANCIRVRFYGLICVICVNPYAMVRDIPFSNVARKRVRHAIRSIRFRIRIRFIPIQRARRVVNWGIRIAMITVSRTGVAQSRSQLCLFTNMDTCDPYQGQDNKDYRYDMFRLLFTCKKLFGFKRSVCLNDVRCIQVVLLLRCCNTICDHVFKLHLDLCQGKRYDGDGSWGSVVVVFRALLLVGIIRSTFGRALGIVIDVMILLRTRRVLTNVRLFVRDRVCVKRRSRTAHRPMNVQYTLVSRIRRLFLNDNVIL